MSKSKEELLKALAEAVVEYDEDACKELSQEVLDNPNTLTPMKRL